MYDIGAEIFMAKWILKYRFDLHTVIPPPKRFPKGLEAEKIL